MYIFPSEAKYEGCWELGVRSGIALQHSKRGITAAMFREGKKESSKDYMPGQSEEWDTLTAKVSPENPTLKTLGAEPCALDTRPRTSSPEP